MKKLSLVLLTSFIAVFASAQQQILLYTETFEGGTTSFDFTSGGAGANSGNNQWIIDSSYSGAPLYANTPSQDSTVIGVINGAPFSTYLHIHDSASGITNANWNNTTASDRFASMGTAFCTLGMTDVIFTFFWIAEGDSNAYGEVYYRADGGAWTKTGQAKYFAQSKWKYETIQDTAFENVQNLEFGFRWVNGAAGGTSNISIGIDDIIAVAAYDEVTNPVTISISYLQPSQVCRGRYITIGYNLSSPLCDGTYEIEMSDAAGSFTTPYKGGVFTIQAPDTLGFIGFQVPASAIGNCYKMRINRLTPYASITGQPSTCFSIINCAGTIFPIVPAVMMDADTTCILSVIDVDFYSIGAYGPGNTYQAQLSDMNGSFASPYQLGALASNTAFPGPAGRVSGVIPANVPPGCGYYIRVVSSAPSIAGDTVGPFCLTRCDALTNHTQDIHVCLNGSTPYPEDATLNITLHRWNSTAFYDTCNDWSVELRSMQDFSLVDSGTLGVFHTYIGGNFTIDFPTYEQQLVAMGVQPGAYYLRVKSNCSDQPWNQTGSVIRITIGAPDTLRPSISIFTPNGTNDTAGCSFSIVPFYITPFNRPPSDYEWASSGLNNGTPFVWAENPLLVNFTNAPANEYVFFVREINYGCTGEYSEPDTLSIISPPSVSISGDSVVCLGDTATFSVDFIKETYYNWDAPAGATILEQGNSEVSIIFNSLGTFTITNFSLNTCDGDSGSYQVNVTNPYLVTAGADTAICAGEPISLTAHAQPVANLFFTGTTTSAQGRQGAMFNIISHADVVIDSFAVKYLVTAQLVSQQIWGKRGTYRNFEQNQNAWNLIGAASSFPANPPSQFTTIPIAVNRAIAPGDTFAFYVTTTNASAVNMQYRPGTGISQEVVFKTDGAIDFVQGSINTYPFGTTIAPRVLLTCIYYTTRAGIHYLWNTGDTAATIVSTPSQTKEYAVTVYDLNGCKGSDSVTVIVNQAGAFSFTDSVCQGDSYSFHNQTLTVGGVYTDTVSTEDGCDSIVTLNLGVKICTGTEEIDALNSVLLYPNPATDELYITAKGIAITQVNIYNMVGVLVSQTDQPIDNRIDVSHLPADLYMTELKTKHGSVLRKWVKM